MPLKLSVAAGEQGKTLAEYAVNTNRAEFFPVDEWVHIAVTYNGADGKVVFYRNGAVVPSTPATSNAKINGNDTAHKYLGFNSPSTEWGYNAGYATMDLDQYEIYGATATAEEVQAIYNTYFKEPTPEEIVTADCAALDPFAGKDKDKITSSISLPTKGKKGSTISWHSSNENVVKTTGKASTQPAKSSSLDWMRAGINTKEATRYNGWEDGLIAGHFMGLVQKDAEME